jgi:protein-S-isoprenylcysteine O-methyltransferase
MTTIRWLWLLLGLTWAAAEIALAISTRRRAPYYRSPEQGSDRLLWWSTIAGVVLALLFKTTACLPLPGTYASHQFLGLGVFASGIMVRAYAIHTLGHLFTTTITIAHTHQLIRSGPYRYLRHPAYTGLLLAFAGAGLAIGDGLALLSLTVVPFFALLRRLRIEEHVLLERFGADYQAYRLSTKRLLPWIW